MSTPNLYWPVYKNLEKEFLLLADYIHFSDDQVSVYSMRIADLIIRCAIEIESLSKELYCQLGGETNPKDENGNKRDLYFDTDCIRLLNEKWRICDKEVSISAINLYFEDEQYRELIPLMKADKRGSSGSKWKQAYQALKHNRRDSLKKYATVLNLLNAMAALFILNVYYRDETIDLGNIHKIEGKFDGRLGSELFCVTTKRATLLKMLGATGEVEYLSDADDLNRIIYILKYTDESFVAICNAHSMDSQLTQKRFAESLVIQEYLKEHPEMRDKTINEICIKAGGRELLKEIISFEYARRDNSTREEAVLNKHTNIYPKTIEID